MRATERHSTVVAQERKKGSNVSYGERVEQAKPRQGGHLASLVQHWNATRTLASSFEFSASPLSAFTTSGLNAADCL